MTEKELAVRAGIARSTLQRIEGGDPLVEVGLVFEVAILAEQWDSLCRDADLSEVDKALLWRRQFLNPLSVEGLEDELESVIRNL